MTNQLQKHKAMTRGKLSIDDKCFRDVSFVSDCNIFDNEDEFDFILNRNSKKPIIQSNVYFDEFVNKMFDEFYKNKKLKQNEGEDKMNNEMSNTKKNNEVYVSKVQFNDPCTIVWFTDGDKIISKTDKENSFDPEIGFAMALMKKMFGSRSQFSKYIKNQVKQCEHKEKNKRSKRDKKIDKELNLKDNKRV